MKKAWLGLVLFSLIACTPCGARGDGDPQPWKGQFGLAVHLNTSQLTVTGNHAASVTSGTQWSAGFGIYCKTDTKNMFRIEAQLAYEAVGSAREFYFGRETDEWVRIYDRYRTIPLSVILNRSIGWKETWSLGLGFKSFFVVGHYARHETVIPAGSSGIIFNPEVKKWVGAPLLQLSCSFPAADISLVGWYAVTPLIDSFGIRAIPFGISFQVKARLFPQRSRGVKDF